ncbi:hypothetical protein RHMOL_Rhmol08G0186100 [Rhododendron molle]|uniref:Uncharacterized protein n=1 Tax=Rhododendron molle TaxID=49168 RepID=A0ACC0MQH6_RHOML|nr:hypothetical protein RHMOL_Rhmol08G0186100 [Rhododendron molle]
MGRDRLGALKQRVPFDASSASLSCLEAHKYAGDPWEGTIFSPYRAISAIFFPGTHGWEGLLPQMPSHAVVESDDEGEGDMDADIGDDADDDDNDDDDDDDNLPLNVHLKTLRAQSSMLAGGLAAEGIVVVAISDSLEEQGEVGIIQPRTGPIPFPHPEPGHSAVIGGMLLDEPSVVDLGGDPNTVSTESSPSSEDSKNITVYSTDRDPSPSNAAPSKARKPPPPMDTPESVGQANIAAEPINAAVARLLREEEEEGNVEEPPHAATGGLTVDQPGVDLTSTPSGFQKQSTSARIRSIESFLGLAAPQALGDFEFDLNLEMGEQQREEVESRERPSPLRSPVVDLGKGPMDAEAEMSTRIFPTGYPVDEAYHPAA